MSASYYIGKDTPRPEAPEKAAGKAQYIHDLAVPGMLFGKIKFSQHAHALIKSIDTSKAEKLPGVRAVITGYNTPPVRVGFLKDNLALKKGKVRQFRDEVAAVAATSPEIAAEAIELIDVEYEPLPGVFSPEEALAKDAPLVHEFDPRGKPIDTNLIPMSFSHNSGDLEKAKAASRHIVEDQYSTQWMQQSCMGTAGCVAEFDMNKNLTIKAKTQIPFLAQKDFLGALKEMGLKGKNARVIVPALGGGFGSGLDTHAYEFICILLAYQTGRPVKILYDRKEEFANLSPRQSTVTKISQGCDENGKLLFRQMEVTQDNGAYVSWGSTFPSVMLVAATSLYRVPNISFDSRLVYTNNTYSQAMRGYGGPEITWAIESSLDQLAEKAGVDRLDIRRINRNQPGETTPMKLKVTTCGLEECMEKAAQAVDWNAERPAVGSKRRGVGIASLCHVGGSGRIYRSDASGVILKLDDFGNVYLYSGSVEMGQGIHSVLKLGTADYLGVLPDNIFINETDTATCPWDVGTHASRGAFTALNAVKIAADKARTRIFQLAEEVFPQEVKKNLKKLRKKTPDFQPPEFDWEKESRAENFELKDGIVFLKNAPDEKWLKLPLDRFLRGIHFRENSEMLTFEGFYEPPTELPDWQKGVGNLSASYAYGSQAAEVEVDIETGEVKILKLSAVHDVGKVLNPQTLKGQMYGALAQGVGYTLYENIISEKGKILNPSFTDYKLPTVHEMSFPIHLEFVETDDQAGPFGAKGIGEAGMIPTAPAIANAIYQAVGVRIKDLPITPEKVLKALKESKSL